MEKLLPLFPLQLVALPGETVPLHIFEPRYKQLLGECRDDGITFGIPLYHAKHLAEYGTEMRLQEIITTYDTGEMDVLVEGLRVFRLHTFHREAPGKLYPGAQVEFVEDRTPAPADTTRALLARYRELVELLGAGPALDDPKGPNLAFRLAPQTGLNLAQRLQLLAKPSEAARQQLLLDHLAEVIPLLENARDRPGGVDGFQPLPPSNN